MKDKIKNMLGSNVTRTPSECAVLGISVLLLAFNQARGDRVKPLQVDEAFEMSKKLMLRWQKETAPFKKGDK